ncbi:MAG: hypothetical protein AAGF11_49150 [Myxococcota bacterium]
MPDAPSTLRARIGLGIAVIGPALALGGVWSWTVLLFAGVIAALLYEAHRRGRTRPIPVGLGLGLLAAVGTLVQALPLPGLRAAVAPTLHAWVALADTGSNTAAWPGLSPTPADTALEALRLMALCGLALLCARRSWRWTAGLVVLAGVAVAGIGLLQHGLGVERIYGLYAPRQLPEGQLSSPLLSTFVNPNHQSGLLLLGIFAAAGLAVANDAEDRRLEPRVVLGIALVLQVAALTLSMSRAALVAAGVVTIPAVLIAWWPSAHERRSTGRGWAARLLGLSTLVGIAIGLGTLGAWHELDTLLGQLDQHPASAARLRLDTSAPALLSLAPLTGIGRKAFGDVFPAFDPEPSHVWFSHLECAPLVMLIEWGPVLGGVLVVGLPAWWLHAVRRADHHEDARARRVALLGLLALALQSLADFSLEFLGVAAPACALAGALAPAGPRRLSPVQLRLVALSLVGLAVATAPLLPSTWTAVTSTTTAPTSSWLRPLHGPWYRDRARVAVSEGRFAAAIPAARAAIRLRPGDADGWLLLAAAAAGQGDRWTAHHATTEALARLHAEARPALVNYLVQHFPEPADLARRSPSAPEPWRYLVEGLLASAPAHADAVAARRAERDPEDPQPLRIRTEAALALERPGLALHHARLWRQLAPHDALAHLGVVRALEAQPHARPQAIQQALEGALETADLQDLRLRGLVEEQLLRTLLRRNAPADHARIRELATVLRARPGDDATQRRRRALVEPVLRRP